MNAAHWHLVVNHFPIVGGFIAFIVLLYGIILRNSVVIKLAYVLFVLIAVSGVVATQTGESAEHYLESIHAADETMVETHAKAADIANYAMIAVGIAVLLTLLIKRIRTVIYMPWVILALSVVALLLMTRAGNLGGEIIHKEIRSDSLPVSPKN